MTPRFIDGADLTPRPLALQLHSLRETLAQNFERVIRRIHQAGYVAVETAGFPGTTLERAVRLFKELEMAVPSAHMPLPIGSRKNEIIDAAFTLGVTEVVSSIDQAACRSSETIHKACQMYNQAEQNLREVGLNFHLHNHWWEFEFLGGDPIYKLFLRDLSPRVKLQLDCYWVMTAGFKPATLISELGERCSMIHLKDGPAVLGEPNTAIGDGALHLPSIYEASDDSVDWWFVEIDDCAEGTYIIEELERSATYLVDKGYAVPSLEDF